MKVLVAPFSLAQMLSFVWTVVNIFVHDFFRYWYREEIEVKTKSGLVKGFRIASSFDYRYFNFIGIPYAKPPLDELRFKVCKCVARALNYGLCSMFLKCQLIIIIPKIGSAAIWAIKWSNQFEIWPPRIDGMASRFIDRYCNGNRRLSSSFSLYTWHPTKRAETSNGLDPWWRFFIRIEFQRPFRPRIFITWRCCSSCDELSRGRVR